MLPFFSPVGSSLFFCIHGGKIGGRRNTPFLYYFVTRGIWGGPDPGRFHITHHPNGREGNVSQVKRLDSHRINLQFREHKAEGTFLKQSCRKTFSSGDEVIGVYILPKYKLCYAMDKPNQMQAMLQLSLVTTFEEIIIAFSKQCVFLPMVLSKTNHYRN